MEAIISAACATPTSKSLAILLRSMLIFCLVVAGGCGAAKNPYATVTGTVNMNGQPIKAGKVIYFLGASSAAGGGSAQIVNGKFALNKVPLGTVVFTFAASMETGKTVAGPGGVPEPERVNIIPAKLANEGITREITGDSVQDFALENENVPEK